MIRFVLLLLAILAAVPPLAMKAVADAPLFTAERQVPALMAMLDRYRDFEAGGGWPDIPGEQEIRLDGSDPRQALLLDRLRLTGDLPSGTGSREGALTEAVRHFQLRHGLEPDGRVGKRTLAALNVSASGRTAQILANLARWDETPPPLDREYVAVNIADATLEMVRGGAVLERMRVIVGDQRHPTPVFSARITGVTVNPPWNVPRSIATREILPRLKRDTTYLARNRMVLLEREDDPHGLTVAWHAISAGAFPFRIRQLPGEGNALGRIKFEMPNPHDVYLHDTPARALFKRSDRGLSHGCIRLEHPQQLAQHLLPAGEEGAATLEAAIASGETIRIPLPMPVPVHLHYWTAFVDDNGAENFRPDRYGRDNMAGISAKTGAMARAGQKVVRLALAGCPER